MKKPVEYIKRLNLNVYMFGEKIENRIKILRLIENMTLGSAAGGYLTGSMRGAGSPQAERIMISREVDMEEKKKSAKKLCGINKN